MENVQQDEIFSDDSEEISKEADIDLEKAMIEHEFSSPWDDSDLILVVEDQKLHVHRSILKMTSPVFKAMLSSGFKEKDANEITLPGKKVNEFVDFLRQIYPLLDSEITLKNVKYIYSLADEYQLTKVMKVCRMFLSSVRKTKENAMDMLLLAEDMEAEEARQQCYDVLKKMTLTELESLEGFSELDGASMQVLLLPVVKRHQKCLKEALPELLACVDCILSSWWKEGANVYGCPNPCPNHRIRQSSPTNKSLDISAVYERINCNACKATFAQMSAVYTHHISPSGTYISTNILNVLEEMKDLVQDVN